MTRAFSSLGRETFATSVTWDDDGWPAFAPIAARQRTPVAPFVDEFDGDVLREGWIAVRALPDTVGRVALGRLVLDGAGVGMNVPRPTFVGRRQTRFDAQLAAYVRLGIGDAVGGISLRIDEQHHYDIELTAGSATGRAVLPTIRQEHAVEVDTDGAVRLAFELRPPTEWADVATSDLIDLVVTDQHRRQVIATFDGRYLSTESAATFARVAGVYCDTGRIEVDRYEERDLAPS